MILSHVRWRFRRERNLVVVAVGEGDDLNAEKFMWVDLRNIMIISVLFHGKFVQNKNAFKYKTEKGMKISLTTSIAFNDEKDINEFFGFISRYF